MKLKKILISVLMALFFSAIIFAQAPTGRVRVKDRITDVGGNARVGTVTFILTQAVTGPDGLIPAKASVSAQLDIQGWFDVMLYPSTSLNPQAYYQLYFKPYNDVSQEFLGLYSIPTSSGIITLGPNKITDTNLVARYKFAAESTVQNLASTASSAALNTLLSGQADMRYQRWDSATQKFRDSKLLETALGATLTGVLTSDGYVGIRDQDIPSTISGKTINSSTINSPTLNSPTISNPTISGNISMSGNITAGNFYGNGANLTGITGATGGVSNSNNTTIAADNDANGSGIVDIQVSNNSTLQATASKLQAFKPFQLYSTNYASLSGTNYGSLVSLIDYQKGLWIQGANSKWYNVSGAVNANEYVDINSAINSGFSSTSTIRITDNQTLTSNATVPKDKVLDFQGDGQITINNGVTLTVTGSIVAPKRKIFNLVGTGRVIFEGGDFVYSRTNRDYPEWWGALPDDGVDDTVAVQAACAAFTTRGYGEVILSGMYTLTSSLDLSVQLATGYQTGYLGLKITGLLGSNSLIYPVTGFEWKGPSTDFVIKAWSRDLQFNGVSVRVLQGYSTKGAWSFDQPVSGAGTIVSNNQLRNCSATTSNNAQMKNIVATVTSGSTTITIPTISGTWSSSGTAQISGSGGSALTQVKTGEYIVYNGTPILVRAILDNNTITTYSNIASASGQSISHYQTFSASNIGNWVLFEYGGASFNKFLYTRITGVTNSTTATISDTPQQTSTYTRGTMSPLGSFLQLGNNARGNNDLHQIYDSISSDSAVGIIFESDTAQVKQVKIYNYSAGICGAGVVVNTGSFEFHSGSVAQSYITDFYVMTPDDFFLIDGFQSENSSRFVKWGGGNGASPFNIAMNNIRWDSIQGDADGIVVGPFGYGGGLSISNAVFGPLGDVNSNNYRISLSSPSGYNSMTLTQVVWPSQTILSTGSSTGTGKISYNGVCGWDSVNSLCKPITLDNFNNITVNGGSLTDNNGNLMMGIKYDNTKFKTGIFITNNFAYDSASGLNGAHYSSVMASETNRANFMGYAINPGGQANSNSPANYIYGGTYVMGNAGRGGGGYYIQLNNTNQNTTGDSVGFNAHHYHQYVNTTTNINNAYSFRSHIQSAVAGASVLNHYDFYTSPISGSGLTITNRYGIYLGHDATGVTNAWGVYQSNANVKNFFAGGIIVGTPTGPKWSSGSGAPTGSCSTGSLYSRTDGTTGATFYVCENSAWVAK